MPSTIPQRQFRCEDTLYLKVQSIANAEHRSVNQQITHVLQKFVEDYEKQHGEIKIDK